MGLMILKCPHCGQRNLIKENEHYRCPMCESIIFNDDYKSYEEAVEKLIHEGKEADIGVLRYSLNTELEQVHLNIDNIKNICRQIKNILPEDVIASFYLTFVERKSYPKNYESFLKQLSQEKVDKYALNQIVPVIINSCDIRVKELVEELLKAHDLYTQENKEKINQALQEREDEIERYDTEKDVFVCHSSKDKEEIVKIVNALEDNSISCWYSGRNLPRDIENYWEGIHKAVNDCRVFLFVLSKYSRMSKDVVHELDYARSLNKKIRIEYRIDEVENNLPIKKCFDGIQWIDGSKQCKHEELAERIYNDLESTNKKDVEKVVKETPKQPQKVSYNVIQAKLLFEKYEEALEEIEKQMMINPNDIHLLELLLDAQLKGKKEKNNQAIRTYEVLYKLFDTENQKLLKEKYSFLMDNDVSNSKTLTKEEIEEAFQKGKEYYNKKDYVNAVKYYKMAAEKGHAKSQYNLGYCYRYGKGVTQDYQEAVKWYKLAAEQEDAGAQNNLGDCYYYGEGVTQNYKEAVKWFRLAAEQGDVDAQSNLGYCYYYGEGVTEDYQEAVKWYKLAAEQGNADAQYHLGYCYHYGKGVTQNYKEAVKWYKLAAEQGNSSAQNNLGDCYYYGYGVTQDYKEAFKWYKKSADQGYAEAQNNLGDCNRYGNGVTKDYQEAVKWYKLAAEQGNSSAQNNLGDCYYYGYGVTKDYKEAVRLYRLSANQGNSRAQYNLGYCYYYGKGVTEDYQEAVKWYKLAAEQGNSRAQNNLGDCYYYGYGVTKDYKEAAKWFKLAAEQGHSDGQNNLGNCYYYGKGVTEDYKEAVKWFRLSANQGNKYAQNNLGDCYYYGEGVTQDYKEAVKWFKLAAEQGNKVAQNNLGVCYKNGTGVEKDYKETLKWYRLAADQGHVLAQKNLGNCYFYGYGVDIDYQEALKWYRLSAEQGNESAIRILREKYKIEV